jgi:putative addiction module CopG family antidote
MKVALAPSLEKFVSKKLRTGTYIDASDVIRESLRRWKQQEEGFARFAPEWLEQEVQEGLDSPELEGGPGFWRDLRNELRREYKNGSARR